MRVICAIRGPDAITAILAAVDADEWADGALDPPHRAMQHQQSLSRKSQTSSSGVAAVHT